MSQYPVTIQYPDGQRVEAVSTTAHSASSYGLPVLLLDGEALGGLDCAAAGLRVVGGEPEALEALHRAGFPVSRPGPFDCTLHPNHTATYWSVIGQEWRTVASQDAIPDVEWAARGPEERAALMAHLPTGGRCEWGDCTMMATEEVRYPKKAPGSSERCPEAGWETMHLCAVCADVARAEVDHILSEHERHCDYCGPEGGAR
jgi:hypothetical protein